MRSWGLLEVEEFGSEGLIVGEQFAEFAAAYLVDGFLGLEAHSAGARFWVGGVPGAFDLAGLCLGDEVGWESDGGMGGGHSRRLEMV